MLKEISTKLLKSVDLYIVWYYDKCVTIHALNFVPSVMIIVQVLVQVNRVLYKV